MTFEEWKKEVDRVCVKVFGLSSDDMADCLWFDYWNDELSPNEAVENAVEDVWGHDDPVMYDIWYGSGFARSC